MIVGDHEWEERTLVLLSPPPVTAADALLPPSAPVQLLDERGVLTQHPAYPLDLDSGGLLALHRLLVLARRVDRQAVTLTRQGQLGVYASSLGQEAAQVGSVAALAPQDWMFPSYRESLATFARGVDIVEILSLFRGGWHCGYDPVAHRVAPLCTPIGTQAVHATGFAMAARADGSDTVAITYFGDGATSEGDPHEAMNFAAVFGAPCVFFVQNNGYAISVPLARQTRAPSIAHKAVGYGMPGYRVDGNDVLATYAVTRAALQRARGGGGPSLIEAVTYRMSAHTTADDASRYRDEREVAVWEARDPVARYERFLAAEGLLTPARRAEVDAEGEQLAERMRAGLRDALPGDPEELFAHVYADPPAHLREQRDLLRTELQRPTA
jgi:pyruvate dehydrogenase E1 component alpha subunit